MNSALFIILCVGLVLALVCSGGCVSQPVRLSIFAFLVIASIVVQLVLFYTKVIRSTAIPPTMTFYAMIAILPLLYNVSYYCKLVSEGHT